MEQPKNNLDDGLIAEEREFAETIDRTPSVHADVFLTRDGTVDDIPHHEVEQPEVAPETQETTNSSGVWDRIKAGVASAIRPGNAESRKMARHDRATNLMVNSSSPRYYKTPKTN